MQNVNTISFSETLLKTLNATWNASQNTMLPNTKNYLMSVLTKSKRQTLPKTLLPNTSVDYALKEIPLNAKSDGVYYLQYR